MCQALFLALLTDDCTSVLQARSGRSLQRFSCCGQVTSKWWHIQALKHCGDSKERLQFVGKKELGRAPSRRHLTWGMCGMVRLLLRGKL